MVKVRLVCIAAAMLAAAPAPLLAQAKTDASVYLRCDGMPAHISIGNALGRALLLSFTMGLAGNPETQDASKRAYGRDGVEACDAAIQGESDTARKAQL